MRELVALAYVGLALTLWLLLEIFYNEENSKIKSLGAHMMFVTFMLILTEVL